MNRKPLLSLLALAILLFSSAAYAQIESAADAVKNMRIGWNLGNTLESNSGDSLNMWLEWSKNPPSSYETAWGQPVATRQLIHMFKEAGFNAIRVPVTWYEHMGVQCVTVRTGNKNSDGTDEYRRYWYQSKWQPTAVDAEWMARVREVVNYVIDEGMYCILNVHHDTGTGSAAWIRASSDSYNRHQTFFENLWTEIATEFRDYDDHLLFEGYNEMTDKYNSWCFATFGSSSKYVAADATDAYNAVNSYAQSFVNAVRATGGNNATRNLIVNTYAGCSGAGSWNSHLLDPLKQMKLPTDQTSGHLCFEIHAYPSLKDRSLSTVKSEVLTMMNNIQTYLGTKAPVIIGEWGTSNDGPSGNDYVDYKTNKLALSQYFVEQAKTRNFATIYWMGLSDGNDRTAPQWTQPELKDVIVKGYYGGEGYVSGIADVSADGSYNADGNADASSAANHKTATFSLTGLRMNADALPSGMYIRNGKKIVKK